jgi:hypothetical protein
VQNKNDVDAHPKPTALRHLTSGAELSDLGGDMFLSTEQSECLTCRLEVADNLEGGTEISSICKPQEESFSSQDVNWG